MEQGLRLVPSFSLELEEVVDINFSEAILKLDRKTLERLRCAGSKEINKYLHEVNDTLFDYRGNPSGSPDLKNNCLVATLMYSFATKIADLGIDEKIRGSFVEVLRRHYDHKHPLKFYFRHSGSEGADGLTECGISVAEVRREEFSDIKFGQSDSFREKMRHRFIFERDKIQGFGNYNLNLHFSLIANREVCFPLFGVNHKSNAEEDKMFSELRGKYGSFCVMLPECFEQEQ